MAVDILQTDKQGRSDIRYPSENTDIRHWTTQHLFAAKCLPQAQTPPQGEDGLGADVDVRGPGKFWVTI